MYNIIKEYTHIFIHIHVLHTHIYMHNKSSTQTNAHRHTHMYILYPSMYPYIYTHGIAALRVFPKQYNACTHVGRKHVIGAKLANVVTDLSKRLTSVEYI